MKSKAAKSLGAKGGKARWVNIPKDKRSKMMRKVARARYKKQKNG